MPGTLAVVSVMLGSVAFDGFSRTATWQNRLFEIEADLISSPRLSDLVVTLVNVAGLTVFVLLVAGFYLLAVAGARAVAHSERAARQRLRLQPRSDRARVRARPLLLVAREPGPVRDSARLRPLRPGLGPARNLRLLAEPDRADPEHDLVHAGGRARLGHVAGLVLAHDRAIALFSSTRTAVRTQYAFLLLMVLYTVGGLWLLSQG